MVPLDPDAARHVRSRLGLPEGPGLLALRHALAYRRAGLWGDDPVAPRSVLLVREGDDNRLEAFGAGESWPALAWLVGHNRPFSLHAPDDWLSTVENLGGAVERVEVETWSVEIVNADSPAVSLPPGTLGEGHAHGPAGIPVRPLGRDDRVAFEAAAPSWALRGWQSFADLIEHGAAFVVSHTSGFASLAWVLDQADIYDAIGVYTVPRFRRLGLGRAASAALVAEIIDNRGKVPLWSFEPQNAASLAIAESLAFSPAAVEHVVYHPPRHA